MSFVQNEDARRQPQEDPVLHYLRQSPLARVIDIPALEAGLHAREKLPYLTVEFYAKDLGPTPKTSKQQYHLNALNDEEKVYFLLKEYIAHLSTPRGAAALYAKEHTGVITTTLGQPSLKVLHDALIEHVAILYWNKMSEAIYAYRGNNPEKVADDSLLHHFLSAIGHALSEFPAEGVRRVDFCNYSAPKKIHMSQEALLKEAALLAADELSISLLSAVNSEALVGKGPFAHQQAGRA